MQEREAASGAAQERGAAGGSDGPESVEEPLSAVYLLVPVALIVLMSIGFALNPPDKDHFYELPPEIRHELLTLREQQLAAERAGAKPPSRWSQLPKYDPRLVRARGGRLRGAGP